MNWKIVKYLPTILCIVSLVLSVAAQDWHWFGYQQAAGGYSGLYSCRPV